MYDFFFMGLDIWTFKTSLAQAGANLVWTLARFTSHIISLQRLTCSFCWDLLATCMSFGSAEVGVILRTIPLLLEVLPDTKAAKSFRNSPATDIK